MEMSRTLDAPSALESSTGLATSRLVEHLSRHAATTLAELLGPSTMELLTKKLGQAATSPEGLAYFFVSARGEHEVLRRPDTRGLLLSKLSPKEATDLCELLQLPAITPHQTLRGINFDTPKNLELLDRWYGVEIEALEEPLSPAEGAQKVVASHKLLVHQLRAFRELRRAMASPAATLVHMPFGAGKLRLVATAALDFFRVADDDKSVVWIAPGAAMCEEAFSELRDVWKQLGSRDTTLLQLYGSYPDRDLDQLSGSIAVIDIQRIAKDDTTLKKLGATTAVAIFADAEDLVHPVGAEIVRKMSMGGPFPLVGILASPGAAIPPGPSRENLKASFSGGCITVCAEPEVQSLPDLGDFMHISGSVVHLTCTQSSVTTPVVSPHSSDDSSLEFDEAYVSDLDSNVQRNERLLELLQAESEKSGRIVFYATTPASARLFAGLLPVLGIPARSITSDESPSKRTRAVQRFVARDERVLCVHGFLLSGSQTLQIDSCVMASPIKSKAYFLSTIGRLMQARDPNQAALRLIVAADAQTDASLVDSLGTWSTLGGWSAQKS